MSEPAPGPGAHLEAAIADLESRRAVLGDAVVDAALAPLRARLADLRAGAPATSSSIAPTDAPRLRQVSILFADIAGSTALLEKVRADEALTLLSPALEAFAAVVRAAGGEVLRFTGDGLKAAFGVRGAREDEAERAVRAGLAILREAEAHAARVRRSHGIASFGVRVGVHTGEVVLGGGMEADRTAMGHAVHLAARLEQSAPVGRLRISHETWAQVRGLFDVDPQPPLTVAGHQAPLITYLVRGERVSDERAPQRGVEGVRPPMIGREREWQALMRLFERCRVSGQPGVAWVIGEAGLGKTRLRREFIDAVAPAAAVVLQARAHPAEMLQPYGLVRQLLARWFGITDDLAATEARARFVAALASRLGPDGTRRAQYLGHLLGLDFGATEAVQAFRGAELREQGWQAWRDALQSAAAGGPLLVVLDDLHWADAASLDFVQRLAQDPGTSTLLLLLARPSLHERLDVDAAGAGSERLVLHALPAQDGQALASALLAAVQPPCAALQSLLLQRAEGNPFYMEELLRMLIDDGVVDAGARPWRVDEGQLASRRVPPTLVGVLQARLDALPAPELSALQQASIVGPVFWDAALAAVDPLAPAALPALERRALIVERPHSAFAHTAERAFHHALLHEVTYGTVLGSVRRAGHARVAQWLAERMAGRAGEFLVATAEQFERAGDAERAFAFYDRARHEAMDRAAYADGLALCERALALPATQAPRRRFQVMVQRAAALEHLGRGADAARANDDLAAFADQHDDDSMRADVASLRMLKADHDGHPDLAQALAEQTLAYVARDGRPVAAGAGVLAQGELAWLALQRGDLHDVRRHIDAGIAHAQVAATVAREDGGYDGYELQLRIIEMHALAELERHAEVAATIRKTLRMLDARPRPYMVDRLNLHCQLARVLRLLGDLDGAEQSVQAAQALGRQIDMPRLQSGVWAEQAELALARGDAATAAAAADEVERIGHAIGLAQHLPVVWQWRAQLAAERGDRDAAIACWRRAEALHREQRVERLAVQAACQAAALCPATPDALAAAEAALALAAGSGRPHRAGLAPEALLACHTVLAGVGDVRAASVLHDLVARLREQLAALDEAAARQRLLAGVPHWRRVAGLAEAAGIALP